MVVVDLVGGQNRLIDVEISGGFLDIKARSVELLDGFDAAHLHFKYILVSTTFLTDAASVGLRVLQAL